MVSVVLDVNVIGLASNRWTDSGLDHAADGVV